MSFCCIKILTFCLFMPSVNRKRVVKNEWWISTVFAFLKSIRGFIEFNVTCVFVFLNILSISIKYQWSEMTWLHLFIKYFQEFLVLSRLHKCQCFYFEAANLFCWSLLFHLVIIFENVNNTFYCFICLLEIWCIQTITVIT